MSAVPRKYANGSFAPTRERLEKMWRDAESGLSFAVWRSRFHPPTIDELLEELKGQNNGE